MSKSIRIKSPVDPSIPNKYKSNEEACEKGEEKTNRRFQRNDDDDDDAGDGDDDDDDDDKLLCEMNHSILLYYYIANFLPLANIIIRVERAAIAWLFSQCTLLFRF